MNRKNNMENWISYNMHKVLNRFWSDLITLIILILSTEYREKNKENALNCFAYKTALIVKIITTNNINTHLICIIYAIDFGGLYIYTYIILGGKTIIIIIRRVPLCVRHRKTGKPRGVRSYTTTGKTIGPKKYT